MVPWPIAVLTLFYGVIATLAAARVWKIVQGASRQSLPCAVGWLALSVVLMGGLPLLRPWARRLAIFGSVVWTVLTLAVAGVLVAARHPVAACGAAGGAALHLIVIRYLRSPAVHAYFAGTPRRHLDGARGPGTVARPFDSAQGRVLSDRRGTRDVAPQGSTGAPR